MNRVQEAVAILKKGGIVIFPTDTAFGIGCRIDDEKAVQRLFKIRKRPKTKSTPVLVDTVKMAQDYLRPIPQEVVQKLIEPYWPGALTIVLQSRIDNVPSLVRGGGTTLGVRIPNHPIARELIRKVGIPILGPSANFHGEKTPYRFEDIDPELVQLVDCVLPGKTSDLSNTASTVIDCSVKPWKVVRQGAVIIQNSKFKRQNYNSKLKNKLHIDTSSNEKIIIGLQIGDKIIWEHSKIKMKSSQVVLPLIDKLLKKNKLNTKDINSIEVNIGPGSYTGLRVGVSIANALAYSLHIPVNNKPVGEFVEPIYQ